MPVKPVEIVVLVTKRSDLMGPEAKPSCQEGQGGGLGDARCGDLHEAVPRRGSRHRGRHVRRERAVHVLCAIETDDTDDQLGDLDRRVGLGQVDAEAVFVDGRWPLGEAAVEAEAFRGLPADRDVGHRGPQGSQHRAGDVPADGAVGIDAVMVTIPDHCPVRADEPADPVDIGELRDCAVATASGRGDDRYPCRCGPVDRPFRAL